MKFPSSALDLYRVKSDDHQIVLYERGDAPVDTADTSNAPSLKGFYPVGHYTSAESLLTGLVWRLRKQKSQRAVTLQQWAELTLKAFEEQNETVRKIAREAGQWRAA